MQPVTPPIRTARSEADRLRRVTTRPSRGFSVDPAAIRVVRAPLRICPLPARIDHQPSAVTGMSIAPPILMALDPVSDETVLLESTGFEAAARFPMNGVHPCRPRDRGNGLRGAVQALRREPRLERGPIRIEEGTDIGPGCVIVPGVCIERGCRIRDGVVIQDAVTLRNAVIPDGRRAVGEAVS